jgi:hypothetical protein
MASRFKTTHSSGQILTGRLWRIDNLNDLPFYSDIPRMDDIAEGLVGGLFGEDGRYCGWLAVSLAAINCCDNPPTQHSTKKFGKGLDEAHPFSDCPAAEVLTHDTEKMFSDNSDALGRKHAGRIWSFMSKFVVLDRFCKTLGFLAIIQGVGYRKISSLSTILVQLRRRVISSPLFSKGLTVSPWWMIRFLMS